MADQAYVCTLLILIDWIDRFVVFLISTTETQRQPPTPLPFPFPSSPPSLDPVNSRHDETVDSDDTGTRVTNREKKGRLYTTMAPPVWVGGGAE